MVGQGFGSAQFRSPEGPRHADGPLDRLLIVAPAAPGGGWDQTARVMQHALEREGLVRVVEVQNVAGAAGTIGLAQFVDAQRGNGSALLVTGLVMLGATIWNDSPVSLSQITPIARLTGEYEVVAVPAASPHRDLRGIVTALRNSPGQVSWGGGSAGGTDHILAGLIGAAAGIDPRRVNYIAFSGGGEAVAALMGGNVTAGVSGYSEFAPHIESGRLRALAISAPSRVPGIDAPTLTEQGLDVVLSNWRGVVAPPDISDDDRRRLTDMMTRMVGSATWRQALVDRGWSDTFEADAAFRDYLASERLRITRIVSRLRGPGGEPSRVGQPIFPFIVLVGSAVVLLLLVLREFTARRDLGRTNVRALVRTIAGLAALLLLLEPLGFVVASTAMFAAVVWALRGGAALRRGPAEAGPSRNGSFRAALGTGPSRIGSFGAALGTGLLFSLAVYLAFTRGLGLALPAGSIWTWMR